MSVQINIVPGTEDNMNGIPVTTIRVSVDMSSVLAFLQRYNVLLKVTLTVKSEENRCEVYQWGQICTSAEPVEFETIVMGVIEDMSQITAEAKGIFMIK